MTCLNGPQEASIAPAAQEGQEWRCRPGREVDGEDEGTLHARCRVRVLLGGFSRDVYIAWEYVGFRVEGSFSLVIGLSM